MARKLSETQGPKTLHPTTEGKKDTKLKATKTQKEKKGCC
jgi:hypothetical protein